MWPLVGRAAELERMAGLRAAEDGRGVVLSGPAGVGKSRLAHDAVAAADADGAAVTWIRATRSAATVPLGAFAGLLPPGVRSDDPLELMRRSADALRERAEGRRVVLGVDDAQLLDPTSAALVLHLTETGIGVRRLRPCARASPARTPCSRSGRTPARCGSISQTLSEEDTGTLVEAVLQAPGRGTRAALDLREQPRQRALHPRAAARRAGRRRAPGGQRLLAADAAARRRADR